MMNTAFVNYMDQRDNLTETLEVPILKNKTTFKQTLPICLNTSKFDSELLLAPKALKDFIHQYKHKKEIFDLIERHDNRIKIYLTKIFFQLFHSRCFAVCYCNNFIIGYNFGNRFIM